MVVSCQLSRSHTRNLNFDLFFTIAKAFGIVHCGYGYFQLSDLPSLMQSDMIPFLFNKLVMPIAVMIPVVGVAYVLLLKFGLVEFIGEFMQPVMRKLFKTPGESAVDALVSYTGGYALAVLLTNDFIKKVSTQDEKYHYFKLDSLQYPLLFY